VFLNNKYHPTAMFFWARGWTEEAVGLVERALKVDPGNLESRIMLGDLYAHAGRLDDAIAYYRTIADIASSDARPLFGLAEMLKRKGETKGAIETLRKAYELSGEREGAAALEGALSEKDYDNAQAAVVRERLRGLEELARERYISPLDFARFHALLGERDKALQKLDMAISERSPMVVLLKVDPAWDRIRDDLRFAAVVRRVGIP
jgi:tetratricopeptide (TPR) repeat protein